MTRKNQYSLLAKSGASLIAITVACGSAPALAQTEAVTGGATQDATASDPAAPTVSGQAVEEASDIVVVGSRASQQSANNRKKRAKTATDSIVADDIGSFPDRNVSEAMSRLPGVALNRNDFGEGEGVSIRGNNMGQTRVELDGVGVQSTHSLSLGVDGGRSADMRELPAELVKSIDVVKGTTADMTEGSLGGGILIQTRSGLDFRKPYYSLRVGAQRNSLSREHITPDFNAVASRKFLDDRLGVIVSGTYTRRRNDSHRMEPVVSGNRGYDALFDFDQSPEKTWEYNPATVGTDDADVNFANSFEPGGAAGLTPREFVTLAAGAQSKAQCLSIFPHNNALTQAQRAQRIVEQQSCLNQWNDYQPSLIRHFATYQDEKRYSIDARADYKLTDNLTVYAKVTQANRKVDDNFAGRTPTSMFIRNAAGTWAFTNPAGTYPRTRGVSPAAPAGFYLYGVPTAANPFDIGLNNTGGAPLPTAERDRPIYGDVLNVVPGSVTVDENHNVTQYTTTNNTVQIDQIVNTIDTKTRYAQTGAEWRLGRLEVDALAGLSKASTTRTDFRTNRTYQYGTATLTLQPNGLWDIALPDNYDEANVDNYIQLTAPNCIDGGVPPNCVAQNAAPASPTNSVADPAYTVAQMPLTTPNFSVSYSPRIGEAKEKLAKLDLTYDTEGMLEFITRVKTGVMYRKNDIAQWGSGGRTISSAIGTFGAANYVPAVILPRNDIRGSVRACQPTAGSSAPGGLSCNFGFVPREDPALSREGVETVTPDELRQLFESSNGPFLDYFRGLPNGGDLPPGWREINSEKLFRQLEAWQFMNFDCMKVCTASDGQEYEQPVNRSAEDTKNIYGMAEFEWALPLGMRFDGNVGVRGVFRKIHATGSMTLNYISILGGFNPNNPTAPGTFQTQSFTQNIDFKDKRRDWLPSVNLNLWAFNDTVVFRAYGGRTVSQPTIGRLIPAGTCTIDDREFLEADGADAFGCSGRIGNPSLKPFTARSRNLSLEWYPNADTVFSAAYGKLNVLIADPVAVTRPMSLFGVNPITGEPIEATFNVPTWENGPGFKRSIWEFSAKTAFTFLPWKFRYLGADANISLLRAKTTDGGQQDPLTGDVMDPPGQSKYYTNLSLWYDDGKLNMRVAYQNRTARFNCITPCGGNNVNFNYPGEGWTNVRMVAPGYNPGIPRFDDGDTYIDAKVSYNFTRFLQAYFEVRNLTKEFRTVSAGEYAQFADGTPRVMNFAYPGRRLMGGVTLKFGGN